MLAAALFASVAACTDPLHDAAVEALGPEEPAVPAGPLHRPGQPCLTCHEDRGPADTRFSFAGTVFTTPEGDAPVCGATIRITNADGAAWDVRSNSAGNFYVYSDDFEARFPARTTVRTALGETVMRTDMNRSGSCGECHRGVPSRDTPGAVWVATAGAGCE